MHVDSVVGEFFIYGHKIADGFIPLHTNMIYKINVCRVF